MVFREYGAGNRDTLLLLHGGGLSWWNFREEAEILQQDYRVILPVLDGHAGSGRAFTSIEDNAAELLRFIDEELGGSVLLVGGLSLGAQTALELLAQRREICRHALIESAALIPARITNALIGPAFGSSYGLVRNRSFAKLQARSLGIRRELFEDYYRDSCAISKADMIAFLKASTAYALKEESTRSAAKLHVLAGGKETGGILRSARLLHGRTAGSTLRVLPGMAHGEFSLNRPGEYCELLRDILKE